MSQDEPDFVRWMRKHTKSPGVVGGFCHVTISQKVERVVDFSHPSTARSQMKAHGISANGIIAFNQAWVAFEKSMLAKRGDKDKARRNKQRIAKKSRRRNR